MRVLAGFVIFLVVTLVVLTLSAREEPNDKAKDISKDLAFSYVTGKNTPKGMGATMFKRLAKEKLGWTVKVYPNALLFDDNDKLMDALESGKVTFAVPSLSRLGEEFQKSFDEPCKFTDLTEVEEFQAKEGQKFLGENKELPYKIDEETKKTCYVGLAYWHSGMKQLSNNKRKLEDPNHAKGLVFRIQPKAGELKRQFENLGAETKPLEFNKVYKALEKGTIDGQENTWSNIYEEKYHKVQSYFTETNHGYLGYMFIVSCQFWNKLSEDDKKKLKEVIEEITKKINEQAKEQDTEIKRKIKEEEPKISIIPLTKDERKEWCDRMKGTK